MRPEASPVRELAIPRTIAELSHAIESLTQTVNDIETRCASVSIPGPKTLDEPSAKSPRVLVQNCEVAARISGEISRVHELREQLERLNARLEF